MTDWLNTVCQIVACDIGATPKQIRFLLQDFMDVAQRYYSDGVCAEAFAIDFSQSRFVWKKDGGTHFHD